MTKVLIADDSPTMRMALRRLIGLAGMEVCGEASSGQQAVDLAASLKPDLITMDVMMPGLDGFQATRAILAKGPARILIVSAAGEALQADISFKALQSGALDLVDKPNAAQGGDLQAWGLRLAARLVELAALPLEGKLIPAPGKLRSKLKAQPKGRIRAVGVASSTGGPPALAELLKPLPKELPFPILIAQHIAPGFMAGLLRWMQTQTSLKLKLAEGGEVPDAGEVWMPRDGADLQWGTDNRLRVTNNAGGVCPNADLLLLSMARHLGFEAVGVVLTGMGQDGAEGLWAMKQAGAMTFAQDAASCVVDGMPSAAVARGGTSQRLNPQEIGFCLAELGGGSGNS